MDDGSESGPNVTTIIGRTTVSRLGHTVSYKSLAAQKCRLTQCECGAS
jgi:hypothetical protein